MSEPAFPLINGNHYDYSDIEIKIKGVTYRGVKEINYKDSCEPGEGYGAAR